MDSAFKKEYIGQNVYVLMESTDEYNYFQLAKRINMSHFCADGYFYDPYKKEYMRNRADDYTLYLDDNGNGLDQPISVKVEWKAEKDV